jgi:hypothetical protein
VVERKDSDSEDGEADMELSDEGGSEEQVDERTGLMALCPAWDEVWLCRIERIDYEGVSVQLWNRIGGTEKYLPVWDWTRKNYQTVTVLMSTEDRNSSRKTLNWVSSQDFLEPCELKYVGLVLDESGKPAQESILDEISAGELPPP